MSNPSANSSSLGSNNTEVESINETVAPVIPDEGFEEISEEEIAASSLSPEPESQSKAISYVLKPLLYTAKYGAKALSATTIVISYTLKGTSHVMGVVSYVPDGASKVLEEIKTEKNKDTVEYKAITFSQNLLDVTSGVIYTASYVPYGAGIVLSKVSDMANQLDSSLSPEKIEQICTDSDLFVNNVSSKLIIQLRGTENPTQSAETTSAEPSHATSVEDSIQTALTDSSESVPANLNHVENAENSTLNVEVHHAENSEVNPAEVTGPNHVEGANLSLGTNTESTLPSTNVSAWGSMSKFISASFSYLTGRS